MATENESGRRETLADVVREMRGANFQPQWYQAKIDAYADRIKAAEKREKAEIEANALAVGGIVEAARHTPGNAAAMYEALKTIHDRVNGLDEECGVDPVEIRDLARAALATPARNCDKMPDIYNLTMHDLAKSPCKSTLEYASREELLALVRWLLAPAAERKGEGDGK